MKAKTRDKVYDALDEVLEIMDGLELNHKDRIELISCLVVMHTLPKSRDTLLEVLQGFADHYDMAKEIAVQK